MKTLTKPQAKTIFSGYGYSLKIGDTEIKDGIVSMSVVATKEPTQAVGRDFSLELEGEIEGRFDPATANYLIRKMRGYGLIMDVQRPLDIDQLRADYRNHKINLGNGVTIERLVPAPIMRTYLVPVMFSRTLQDPLKPSRAIQFYVKVKADDATMAAHLAGSITRHKWAAPRHSMNISLSGVVAL